MVDGGALMSSESEHHENELIREILGYFLSHPQSADSLEGIARWRLLHAVVHRALAETSRALEWLVEQGYLHKVSAPGSEHVFSLNLEKREEAAAFMQRPDLSPPLQP
jgi:Fe2+ or Zn2+ uptake regulation protein